jgi:hypothetical protein
MTVAAVLIILVFCATAIVATVRISRDVERLARDIDRACKQAEAIMARWSRP